MKKNARNNRTWRLDRVASPPGRRMVGRKAGNERRILPFRNGDPSAIFVPRRRLRRPALMDTFKRRLEVQRGLPKSWLKIGTRLPQGGKPRFWAPLVLQCLRNGRRSASGKNNSELDKQEWKGGGIVGGRWTGRKSGRIPERRGRKSGEMESREKESREEFRAVFELEKRSRLDRRQERLASRKISARSTVNWEAGWHSTFSVIVSDTSFFCSSLRRFRP